MLGVSPTLPPLPATATPPIIILHIVDAELTGTHPPCYDSRLKAKVHVAGFKKHTTAPVGGSLHWDEVLELETTRDLHRVFKVSVQTGRFTQTLGVASMPLRSLELLARKKGLAEHAFVLKDPKGERKVGTIRCEMSIRDPPDAPSKRRKSVVEIIAEQSHRLVDEDGLCERLTRCFRPARELQDLPPPSPSKRMSDDEVLALVRQQYADAHPSA
mmetsp:Transcript_15009/g.38966  ORF Transcript_15009/g.38966 Transcript_15009/m.38966 type:complete len:215 (-) Transcript_15009:112-756(-)